MRKNIKTTEAIFPMPVLMIATYNEDGSIDVMNAAWGTMLSRNQVILNLTETHRTVKNIKKRKAFTVSIADSKHVVEADYFGVVSGDNTPNKFENSGLTATKSENVDAPIINEFPICFECEFIEYQDDEYTYDSFNALYPDLAHIGIAYTTTPDNEHEIQYEISLENYTATQYIDNKPISKTDYIEQYGSKEKALENMKLELEMCEFTDFVSINEDD